MELEKGRVETVRDFAKVVEKLLNLIWGTDWGTFAPAKENSGNSKEIKMPRILYSTNYRELKNGLPVKPKKLREDKKDGENFLFYHLFYDSMVEFNIVAETYDDCEDLAERFENAIIFYNDILKYYGVQEILFQKEIPPQYSLNFSDGGYQKCLLFKVSLQKIRKVRTAQIKEIIAVLSNK